MLQQRAEEAGVDVRRGVSAGDVRRHRGRRVTGIDTSAGPVRAAMVVDGAGDTHWLARRLGIARQAASPRLVASYGYVRAPRGKHVDPQFTIDHIGWTWIAAVRPGVLQWTRLATDGRRVADRPATLDTCEPIGRDRGADVTWRIASDLAGPGWLIAGDGAWVLDPSSSHGVLKALMSGICAAHTAATAIATPEHAAAASERYATWLRRWFDSDRAELSRRGATTRADRRCVARQCVARQCVARRCAARRSSRLTAVLRPLTDLREQLDRTFSGRFSLERELTGGGMSRVFVATETALGREVVIKVLSPEAAAGVSADRFRREILLAAQLQHPHIVPLLAAGERTGCPTSPCRSSRASRCARELAAARASCRSATRCAFCATWRGARVRARARRRAPRHQARQRAAVRRRTRWSPTSASPRR